MSSMITGCMASSSVATAPRRAAVDVVLDQKDCAAAPNSSAAAASVRVDRGSEAGQGRAMDGVPLDALITRMLARSPFDYRVAAGDSEREIAYRLRGTAVLDRGWCTASDLPGGMECDKHDDRAIQVIG